MKGSLRLRAAFRVFRKSSTLAFLQLDTIAARQQPAAMSCHYVIHKIFVLKHFDGF